MMNLQDVVPSCRIDELVTAVSLQNEHHFSSTYSRFTRARVADNTKSSSKYRQHVSNVHLRDNYIIIIIAQGAGP
jgi:hypothetical protein